MGKPRSGRPSRHSTRRSGENTGSLSVRSLGTRSVASIDADISPANQLSISSNCQEVRDRGEGGGRVSEDGVKKIELDSPTKLVQSIPEMSVRGLLSRLPGSHSPSPQRTRPSDDRKLSEERQSVALRLMQSQKEGKQSEKSSPTLSAVLTGCSQNEIVGKSGEGKKEGVEKEGNKEGNKDGANERKELECELTISIKLNSHAESKDATAVNADSSTGKESESGNRSTGDQGMGDQGMEDQGMELQLSSPEGASSQNNDTRPDGGSESATLDISSATTPFSESAQLDPTTTNTSQRHIKSTISETGLPDTNVTTAELGDVSLSQPNVSSPPSPHPPQSHTPSYHQGPNVSSPPSPHPPQSRHQGTTESSQNSPTLQVDSTATTVQSSSLQPNTLSVTSSPDSILQPLYPTPPTPPPSANVPSQTSLTGSEPAIVGDFLTSLQNGISSPTPLRVPEDVPVTNFSEPSSIQQETDCQTCNVSLNSDPSLFGVGVASTVEGAREEDVGLILAESIENISLDFASSECLVVSVPDSAHPIGAVPDNAHHVSDNSSLGDTRVSVFESHSHSNGSEWFQNGTETLPTVVHIREALAVKQNGCGHIDEGGVALDVHFPQKTVLVAHKNGVYSDRDSTLLSVPQTKLPRPLQSLSLQLVPSALDTPTSLVAPDDDGDSPPISELSSLTPDSAHFGPSGTSSSSIVPASPLSSPVPLPSLPGPRWTPQRCEVTMRECRVSLRPLGKEWTPSKKTTITESEPLLPKREEEKEAEKGEGEKEEVGRGEEKKKEGERGESELEVEVKKRTRGEIEEGPGLVPKRLRFTVGDQDGEKRDGIIPDSVQFHDAQPVARSVVENPQPPVLPDLEIARPKITNLLSPAGESYSEQTNTDKALTAKEEHMNGKNVTVSLAVDAVNFSLPSEHGSEGLNRESECLNGGGEGLNGSRESLNEGGKGLTGGSEGLNDRACAGDKQADQMEVEGEIDEGLTLEETRPVSVEDLEPHVLNNTVVPSPLPSPPAVMEVNEVNAEAENSHTKYSTITTTEIMESRNVELDEGGSAESIERKDVELGERGSAVNIEGKDERGSPECIDSKERELGKVLGGGVVETSADKVPGLGGGIGSGEEGGEEGRDGREEEGEGEERQVHGQQFEEREGVEENVVENEEKAENEPNVMKEKGGQMSGTEEEFGLLHLLAQVAVDASPEVDITHSSSEDTTADKPVVEKIENSDQVSQSAEENVSTQLIMKPGNHPKRAWRKRRNTGGCETDGSSFLAVTGTGRRGTEGGGARRRIRVLRSTRSRRATGRALAKENHERLVGETNASLVSGTEERGEVDVIEVSCERDGNSLEPALLDVSLNGEDTCYSVEAIDGEIVVVSDDEGALNASSVNAELTEQDSGLGNGTSASKDGAKDGNLAEDGSKEVSTNEIPTRMEETIRADNTSCCLEKFEIPTQPQVDQPASSMEPPQDAVVTTTLDTHSPPSVTPDTTVGSEYSTQSCDVVNTAGNAEKFPLPTIDSGSHDTGKRSHDMFVGDGDEDNDTTGAEQDLATKRVRMWRGRGAGRGRTRMGPNCMESRPENVKLDPTSELESTEEDNEMTEPISRTTRTNHLPLPSQTPQFPTLPVEYSPEDATTDVATEPNSPSSLTQNPQTSLVVSFPLLLVKLPHHQQLECYSTSQFQPGDVVWAKAPQLPGWPGLVIDHSQWKRNRLQPAPDGKVRQLTGFGKFLFPSQFG